MVIQTFPVPGNWSDKSEQSPYKQMQQDFATAVAKQDKGSEQWWNGVAAAINGIVYQMSFEWAEGKFCPIEGYYDENGVSDARAAVLQDQLMPHLKQTNGVHAVELGRILWTLKQYNKFGAATKYNEYKDDMNDVMSSLSAFVKSVPELEKRNASTTPSGTDEIPYIHTKPGFSFNV